jgi:hypothetical protein
MKLGNGRGFITVQLSSSVVCRLPCAASRNCYDSTSFITHDFTQMLARYVHHYALYFSVILQLSIRIEKWQCACRQGYALAMPRAPAYDI